MSRLPKRHAPVVQQEVELTPLQERLVAAMVTNGGSPHAAIKEAGYADASAGYRALRSEAVQYAIMRAATAAMIGDIGAALATRRVLLAS